MNTYIKNKIENILAVEDIEGLIGLGAPADEYNSEAEKIYDALRQNDSRDLLEKIYFIWAESFNLEIQELEKRKEVLDKVCNLIINL